MIITSPERSDASGRATIHADGAVRTYNLVNAEAERASGRIDVIDVDGGASHRLDLGGHESAVVVVGGSGALADDSGRSVISEGSFAQLPAGRIAALHADAGGLRVLLITGGHVAEGGAVRRVGRIGEVEDNPFHDPDAGFLHMSARWLIDSDHGGSRTFTLGQSTFAGERGSHELHRHPGGQEFFYILEGEGVQLVDDGEPAPMGAGDLVFVPRSEWHGFRNTGSSELRAIFGYLGAESLEAGGYELP
ncbi:cupin domain-containing protein [Microbacterium sp. ARD31]|uniref:cupin domain-containing protein n=1 Tax=Microbacterium sp. ARD31 TaxID=2962576 RepID=UPI002882B632|nr:cupin domain-containing protein [Microbacterium sp. ARD31]MDT0183976.1 cupin domain-containing protein [Microbacterium sp. ARD31]